MASFFFLSFFFRQTTELIAYVPLFIQTSRAHSFTCTRQCSVYGEPSGHGFESLLQPETFSSNFFRHCATLNFFRHCATFFRNFFLSPKGPPFKFFDILQQTEVSKSPKGPPFLVFRHYETVSKISFFVFFFENFSKKNLYFLNVSKGFPSTFLIFCSKLKFQKAQRVPLLVFGTVRLFQNSHFSFFFEKFFEKNFRKFLSPKSPPFIFF